MMKSAAIIPSNSPQQIDHFAPICFYFNAKLLFTEKEKKQIADFYYPNIKSEVVSHSGLDLGLLSKEYDVIFHSFFWRDVLVYQEKLLLYIFRSTLIPFHEFRSIQQFQQYSLTLSTELFQYRSA